MKKTLIQLAALAALFAASAQAAIVEVAGGDITTNTTWTASNEYVLNGIVFVKNATLTIEPGTIIRGQPRTNSSTYNPGTLVITKSGKINAVGTAANPIIFTTAAVNDGTGRPLDANADNIADRWTVGATFLDANPKTAPLAPTYVKQTGDLVPGAVSSNVPMAGLAGGIIVLGEAPTNRDNTVALGGGFYAEGEAYIEGLPETDATSYGGIYPFHSSGKLAYISIRHGGNNLAANNEINGLTLAGVGAGTLVEFIDVYCNLDDGVEIFGGTVNVRYLNINFVEDDGFDVDQGWTGGAQFLFVLQHSAFGDALVEADGHDEDPTNGSSGASRMTANGRPFQYCVISNLTGVGRAALGGTAGNGIRMRAGFGGEVLNSLVVGCNQAFRIDAATGSETDGFDARTRALTGEIVLRSNTANGNTANTLSFTKSTGSVTGTFDTTTSGWNNSVASPGFKAWNLAAANGVNPVALQTGQGGSPASLTPVAALPNSPFFATVTYRGAFPSVKTSDLWTTGWTALNKRGVLVTRGNQ